jgi:cellulose synthase/poly-beta-1,6-N-acetylglucosamine synthase-like glycosyltransferase
MPAHNEAGSIARFIEPLVPQLGERVRLVVIADNCADDTASAAHAAGATVIERHHATLRGKGHALAFGRDWLAQDPPDVVVVLDADCELESDSLNRLAETSALNGRPVQSCYLMRSRPSDAAMVQISNFAFLIKNLVRQRGAARIGAPAILGGTGMAFPWALFKDAPLATSHLVEDLVLGIDFARAGHAPLFLEGARTWSSPAAKDATRTQRTRWEHGYLQTATRAALPLVGEGLMRGRWGLIWLGLSLAVPPLALLMTLGVALLGATVLLGLLGASWLPAAMLFAAMTLTTIALGFAWASEGRIAVSGATLLRIPLYLLWKLPVYLKLVRGTQSEWVRTERAGE